MAFAALLPFIGKLGLGMGTGLLGKLFGGGKSNTGPMEDQLALMQKLFGEYQGDKAKYSPYLMDTIGYLSGGGSATEKNRAGAMAQALSPINRMIPDVRTRQQNAMAKAGIILPGTVQQKMDIDLGTQEAWSRAQAIEEVNQRFDKTLDTNKAAAGQLAGAQVSQIQNLLASMMGMQGRMAEGISGMQSQEALRGFNPGDMFGSLAGGQFGELFKLFDQWFGGGKSWDPTPGGKGFRLPNGTIL